MIFHTTRGDVPHLKGSGGTTSLVLSLCCVALQYTTPLCGTATASDAEGYPLLHVPGGMYNVLRPPIRWVTHPYTQISHPPPPKMHPVLPHTWAWRSLSAIMMSVANILKNSRG